MPADFHFPRVETELWFCQPIFPSPDAGTGTSQIGIARLKEGVTPLDMAHAYETFATGGKLVWGTLSPGQHRKPAVLHERFEPNDRVVTPIVRFTKLPVVQPGGEHRAVNLVGELLHTCMKRVAPDRVFLWNDRQRDEACELHGVPADRVVVTGAQLFDQFLFGSSVFGLVGEVPVAF